MGKASVLPLTGDKFLTQEEDMRLGEILNRYQNRDTLIFAILRRYGMRSGELLATTPLDLDRSAMTLLIRGSKGSKSRLFPISKDLFTRLCQEADKCPTPSSRIFDISYNRLCDIWHHYRPVPKKLHSLRHTFTIATFRKTRDHRFVQKALGHKHLATTEIYLDFEYSTDELNKALNFNAEP